MLLRWGEERRGSGGALSKLKKKKKITWVTSGLALPGGCRNLHNVLYNTKTHGRFSQRRVQDEALEVKPYLANTINNILAALCLMRGSSTIIMNMHLKCFPLNAA